MRRATTGKDVIEHHNGAVRHYKATDDVVEANMGVEVVEVILREGADIELDIEDWDNNYIKPGSCRIDSNGNILLYFYHCYE